MMFCRRLVRLNSDLAAVRRPADVVDVVPDHVVGERLAVADVDLRRLLARHVVDEQVTTGLRRAGLRVRLDVQLAVPAWSGPAAGNSPAPASRRSGRRRASSPSGDHHMAVFWSSSSPYTQLAVPNFMRSAALPSVVIAIALLRSALLSQRLGSCRTRAVCRPARPPSRTAGRVPGNRHRLHDRHHPASVAGVGRLRRLARLHVVAVTLAILRVRKRCRIHPVDLQCAEPDRAVDLRRHRAGTGRSPGYVRSRSCAWTATGMMASNRTTDRPQNVLVCIAPLSNEVVVIIEDTGRTGRGSDNASRGPIASLAGWGPRGWHEGRKDGQTGRRAKTGQTGRAGERASGRAGERASGRAGERANYVVSEGGMQHEDLGTSARGGAPKSRHLAHGFSSDVAFSADSKCTRRKGAVQHARNGCAVRPVGVGWRW